LEFRKKPQKIGKKCKKIWEGLMGVAQVVEHLPSKFEVLSQKKKKKVT
jgi:hypothetical protein